MPRSANPLAQTLAEIAGEIEGMGRMVFYGCAEKVQGGMANRRAERG